MKLFRSTRFLLLAFLLSLVPASSFAGVFVSINIAPPELPVYVQPDCPEDGYLWTPGYWAYGEFGYYWVPGAWVPAPQPGYLWTPPYWGWQGGNYLFHDGYWGSHVGYYGGVNYGFGYMGIGFAGGEWRGGHFAYNTAIMHVNTTIIHNTYVNETIVHNNTIVNDRRVAFSGGPNGIRHEPTAEEKRFSGEKHTAPTSVQRQHFSAAAKDPQQRFNTNHGKPATVAAARPIAAHNEAAGRAAAGGRTEGHNTPQSHSPTAAPHSEARPATAPRTATHATTAPRTESHPAAQPRQESRPAAPRTESRPAAPRTESRPAAPRTESHPAAPRTESRPAAPRTESRPAAPQSHPAPHPAKPSGEKPHGRGR